MNGSMNGSTNERMHDWIHERVNEWVSEWVNEWMNQWTNQWSSEQINERANQSMRPTNQWTNEQMNEWMDEWMYESVRITEWMNQWKNEGSNERIHECSFVGHFFTEPPVRWVPLLSATCSLASFCFALCYLFCDFCKRALLVGQPVQCVLQPASVLHPTKMALCSKSTVLADAAMRLTTLSCSPD